MKKKLIILLIAVILIGTGLYFQFSNKIEKPIEKEENNILNEKNVYMKNFKITKLYKSCILEFDLIKDYPSNVDMSKYKFYFLDEHNNLIYKLDGKIVNAFENNFDLLNTNINIEINYDISSAVNPVVLFDDETYSYKEDLTNSLKKMPLDK